MGCVDIECGYLEAGCGNCGGDILNNLLATQFLDQALRTCRNPEAFEGVVPCCGISRMRFPACDLVDVPEEWTHPGYVTNPDDPSGIPVYAGWWYDPQRPNLTNGIYGFVGVSHTVGSPDQFEGSDRDLLRRSPRRLRKGIRVGVIRGAILAASKAHAQHAIEILRNIFVNGQTDCPCAETTLGFHRYCCPVEDGMSGYRQLFSAGGFDIQLDEDQPGAGYCDGVCRFTITYESTSEFLYAADETIKCTPEIPAECVCYEDCSTQVETELVEVTTRTPRTTRTVKLLFDQNTGEKVVCPVDFEWAEYDPATDLLVNSGLEGVELTETECKPYRVRLLEGFDGSLSWERINPARWPADGSIPCDCDIIVAEIVRPNPNYDPTCPDCPGYWRTCAEDVGFVVDPVTGLIANLPVGQTPNSATLWAPGVGNGNAWHRLGNYLECIQAVGSSVDAGDTGIEGLLTGCESVSPAPLEMAFRVLGGVIQFAPVSPAFYTVGGPFGAANCNGTFEDIPGVHYAIPAAGAETACGSGQIPEHCLEFITEVLNVLPTGTDECYFAALNVDGTLSPDGWGGLADIEYGSIAFIQPDCPEDPTEDLLAQCSPPIPPDACVDITINDAATGDVVWQENNFTVGPFFPYDYEPSQIGICQDSSIIEETTYEERPVRSSTDCAPPGVGARLTLPGLPLSAWEQRCPPLMERRIVCDLGALNPNTRYAGRVVLANNGDTDIQRIEVLWLTSGDLNAPTPGVDWSQWVCQRPAAIQRIPDLPAGEGLIIDDCGTRVLCGREWIDGRQYLDAATSCPPVFLGGQQTYAVVRVPCDCGIDLDTLSIGVELTPVDTL